MSTFQRILVLVPVSTKPGEAQFSLARFAPVGGAPNLTWAEVRAQDKRVELPSFLREKRAEILQLSTRHGATRVRVFGSIARGEATDESDVDLLVVMKEGASFLDLVALWQDLEALLERKVDLVSEGGLSPHLRERILGEAVPL